MPLTIRSLASEATGYGNPFVGDKSGAMHVVLDVSALTSNEVDSYGYLKPGVILTSAGVVPGAANAAVVGVVAEATPIVAAGTTLSGVTNDPFVVIYTIGMVNRDIIEDNLGRALTANEIAALNTAPSRIVLSLT